MKSRLIFLPLILIAAMLAFPTTAYAHRPVWGEDLGVTKIENLSTSFAFYREFKTEKVHVYSFEGQAGQSLHAGIQIPAIKGLEEYSVSMAILGPGFPEVDEALLPLDHPENLGAMLFPSETTSDFFEPFTQTNYWGRQRADITLPADGTYYILIWNPEGKPGKYVMDSGRAEIFGPQDLFLFPIWWLQTRIYFGQGPYLALIGLSIVAVIAGLFIRRQRSTQE
jgi:hypothetical protein